MTTLHPDSLSHVLRVLLLILNFHMATEMAKRYLVTFLTAPGENKNPTLSTKLHQ